MTEEMYLNKELDDQSRVWIYAADHEFSDEEVRMMKERVKKFVEGWTSHSKLVKAGFEIRYNRFLILMLDESHVAAGGCSIDSSVRFIKSLEEEFSNSLTDRMKFAFKKGSHVENVSRKEFEQLVTSGMISDETPVFNNLVQSKKDLDLNWEIPFAISWHKSFFS